MANNDMKGLRIIDYPDPRLRKRCEPVEHFDAKLAGLAERMLELMRAEKGVGLAAPQVGVLLQLFVCNISGEADDDRVVVNPELTDLEGNQVGEEGCLSIPDVTVDVHRAKRCVLIARDLRGRPIRIEGVDLAARCWQHEVDHLHGRLILDKMSESDKIANRKQLKKLEAAFKKR